MPPLVSRDQWRMCIRACVRWTLPAAAIYGTGTGAGRLCSWCDGDPFILFNKEVSSVVRRQCTLHLMVWCSLAAVDCASLSKSVSSASSVINEWLAVINGTVSVLLQGYWRCRGITKRFIFHCAVWHVCLGSGQICGSGRFDETEAEAALTGPRPGEAAENQAEGGRGKAVRKPCECIKIYSWSKTHSELV